MAAEHIQFERDLETRYTARLSRQLNEQAVNRDQTIHTASQANFEMILEAQLDDNAIVRDIVIKQSLAPAYTAEPDQ